MNTLAAPLAHARRAFGSHAALVCGDERVSYTDLWRRCRKLRSAC